MSMAVIPAQQGRVILLDTPRYNHMYEVRGIIGVQLEPRVQFAEIPMGYTAIPGEEYVKYHWSDGFSRVQDLVESSPKEYHAVNVSMGSTVRLYDLAARLGVKLPKSLPTSLKGLNRLKDKWHEKLHRMAQQPEAAEEPIVPNDPMAKYQPTVKELDESIHAIEAVIDDGVPVFLAGGNGDPDYINVFALAQGITTVGGLEDGRGSAKLANSNDNPFITQWTDANFPWQHGNRAVSWATANAVAQHVQENVLSPLPLEV